MRFQGAIDNPSILQDDWVQRTRNVEIADLLYIGTIVVHAEQLQGALRVSMRRDVSVTVAGEDNLPTGHRGRADVVYSAPKRRFAWLWATVVLGPVGSARVGGKGLIR